MIRRYHRRCDADLLAGFGPKGYADGYTLKAFGQLLGDVAKFAQAHGLSGEDVVVSGHSLGRLAVNSMAAQSDANWGWASTRSPTMSPSPRRPST